MQQAQKGNYIQAKDLLMQAKSNLQTVRLLANTITISDLPIKPELQSPAPRKKPKTPPGSTEFLPFMPEDDLVPPMANAGEGYNVHVTGLTHDERGYPVINAEAQDRLVRRLCEKINKNRDKIVRTENYHLDDAEIAVVAYGITSRVALRAVQLARKDGIKAGLVRLITAWPFPERIIRTLTEHVKAFIVPEINYGQMVHEVERVVCGNARVSLLPHLGGAIHSPKEILEEIKRQARGSVITTVGQEIKS